jgi:hypothetical protein
MEMSGKELFQLYLATKLNIHDGKFNFLKKILNFR